MGQKLFEDKIGNLTESGGTITLAPSVLTIGGGQFRTQALNITPSGTVASTFYRIYAILSSGTPQLVVSTNNNLQGPAGYNAWKLIGTFYTGASNDIFALSKARVNGQVDQTTVIGKVRKDGTQGPISGDAQITGWTVIEDPFNIFSGDLFTVPAAGNYLLSATVQATTGSAHDAALAYEINDDGDVVFSNGAKASAEDRFVGTAFVTDLNSGDTVKLSLLSGSGTTVQPGTSTEFQIIKIPDVSVTNDEDL